MSKRSVLKLVNENETFLVIICPIKMFTWTQNSFISMSQKILWKSVQGRNGNDYVDNTELQDSALCIINYTIFINYIN